MSIESRIKQVRNEFNLTQSEFAESLGVTRNMISMYELSHVAPPQLFLDHLCLKYGVDPIWLETGDGEMFHEQSIDEEIAEFAGKILGGDNQFKKQVFYALSQMDDAAWDAFQQFYNAMKEAERKEKDGN